MINDFCIFWVEFSEEARIEKDQVTEAQAQIDKKLDITISTLDKRQQRFQEIATVNIQSLFKNQDLERFQIFQLWGMLGLQTGSVPCSMEPRCSTVEVKNVEKDG